MSALSDLFKSIGDAIHKITGDSVKIKPTQFADIIKKMAYIDNGKVTGKINRTDVAQPKIEFNQDTGVFTATQNQPGGLVTQATKVAVYQVPTFKNINVTPADHDIIAVTKGNYMGGDVTVKGDTALKSENIAYGKSIFGVQGNCSRLRNLPKWHDAEVYGNIASDCAKSYHITRGSEGVEFIESSTHGLFIDGVLTDDAGRCCIDNATFAGLIARNITFDESPYAKVYGQPNRSLKDLGLTKYEISNLNDIDPYLDWQTHEDFQYSFRDGFKSIKTAGELAEYLYQQGRVIRAYTKENPPSSLPHEARAGDMIFWSKPSSSEHDTSFMGITHVGICACDPTKFYLVKDTITTEKFEDFMDDVVLIARPDYRPKDYYIPTGLNLLPKYCYDHLSVEVARYGRGMVFKSLPAGGFTVKAESAVRDDPVVFNLIAQERPLILTPGKYQLSGVPVHPQVSSTGTSRTWGLCIKTATGNDLPNEKGDGFIWDRGKGDTFTLNYVTPVYVYFYVAESLTNTSSYSVQPKLVKVS